MSGSLCDVCETGASVGVAAVPGVPISVAYCRDCSQANAHPWWVLVANTACIDGLEYANDWWVDMVLDTCRHLGRDLEKFKADVAEAIAAEQEALAALEAEESS